jgi:branched-subunit amino acid transport protein AzlD
MTSSRRTAAVAGALFLVTHVTSVTALALYGAIRTHADYIAGSGPDTPALLGAFLEVVLAIAVVGTAVTLFPVVKRHNESLALGYVGLRTLEAAIIAVGVVPLLAVVTLRQDRTPDAIAVGRAMVALHDWTFLVGPSLVLGTNTVLLATVLYRSGLVPRFIPVLGLVGGPLVFASGAAQLFGLYPQISAWAAVTAVPVFAWEICLALYLVVKGFRPSAVAAQPVTV